MAEHEALYKDVSSLEVVSYIRRNDDFEDGVNFVLEKLDAIHVADVQPVRHGKWTTKDVGFLQVAFVCSACGGWEHALWHDHRFMKYCPNCGAKMDGD